MYYKILSILAPGVSSASGTTGGYFVLGFFLSIPSLIVVGILYFFIVKQSERKTYSIVKVGVICILVLVPCGISLTSYGVLVPNWAAIQDGNYIAPIVYSTIISFIFSFIYKKKWGKNNESIEVDNKVDEL